MNPTTRVVALAIACVLVGVLVGYLYWGQESGRLAGELATLNVRMAEERQQAENRLRELEARLEQSEAQLKEITAELELERQRRSKLELLLSQGRK